MYTKLSFIVFFICSMLGKAQMAVRTRPSTKPALLTTKATKESPLNSKLRALENRFLNKTVDLKEVKQYGDAIQRNHTQELRKSIELFQKVFGPHIQQGKEPNRSCIVRQEERKMGRGVVPRRIKVRESLTAAFFAGIFRLLTYLSYLP